MSWFSEPSGLGGLKPIAAPVMSQETPPWSTFEAEMVNVIVSPWRKIWPDLASVKLRPLTRQPAGLWSARAEAALSAPHATIAVTSSTARRNIGAPPVKEIAGASYPG